MKILRRANGILRLIMMLLIIVILECAILLFFWAASKNQFLIEILRDNWQIGYGVVIGSFAIDCIMLMLIVICFIRLIWASFSKNERRTAKYTWKIRKYCFKTVKEENDDDSVKELKKTYNKMVNSMRIMFDRDGNVVFDVKIANLEQKKIFETDKDEIVNYVKMLLPDYTFSEQHQYNYSFSVVGYKLGMNK